MIEQHNNCVVCKNGSHRSIGSLDTNAAVYYWPRKTGFRFSLNARIPSVLSRVRKHLA